MFQMKPKSLLTYLGLTLCRDGSSPAPPGGETCMPMAAAVDLEGRNFQLRSGAGQGVPSTPEARATDPVAYGPLHQLSRLICVPEATRVMTKKPVPEAGPQEAASWKKSLKYPLPKSPQPCPCSEVLGSRGVCPHLASGEGLVMVGSLRVVPMCHTQNAEGGGIPGDR